MSGESKKSAASTPTKHTAQVVAKAHEKMNSSHRGWNEKGGWLKKEGEPNVFDITLDDIVATREPLQITSILGREPNSQYPTGCSVLFLRDLLRRFSIPYKSLSKNQCLARLAAFKFNLPMPEFDTAESSDKAATSQKKKRSVEMNDKTPSSSSKRAKKLPLIHNHDDTAPPLDTLLEALTLFKETESGDALEMLRAITHYYLDKRVIDLQSHYWQCLERVKELCTKHDVNWDSWKDKGNYEASSVHPDCIEARKLLDDVKTRLDQARAAFGDHASGDMSVAAVHI